MRGAGEGHAQGEVRGLKGSHYLDNLQVRHVTCE